jgi:hypothetical protein
VQQPALSDWAAHAAFGFPLLMVVEPALLVLRADRYFVSNEISKVSIEDVR